MAFGKTTLPAIKPQSVTLIPENGSAIVPADRPQAAVTRAAVEVLTASPTPRMTEADKRVLLGLYIKAVAGFSLAVVLWTFDWLLLHNPRNTPSFASHPTVQDVYEACRRTDDLWRRWVVWFWLGGDWAKPSTGEVIKKDNDDLMQRYSAAQRGGPPGEAGCIVPYELQIQYLREEIERQMPEVETADERMRNGYYSDPLLLKIKDEALERMPQAAFPDGAREKIRSIRDARSEAARKAEEHEAYINSLPDEVRSVRWTVVASEKWKAAEEADIMAETNRRLELIREGRAEAKANGSEFTGCSFEDGSEWHEKRRTDKWRRSIRREDV